MFGEVGVEKKTVINRTNPTMTSSAALDPRPCILDDVGTAAFEVAPDLPISPRWSNLQQLLAPEAASLVLDSIHCSPFCITIITMMTINQR
jgi:hypothetical protein